MNRRIVLIVLTVVVALSLLSWIRSEGRHAFDIRSIVPFMRGSDTTVYDWGGLVLVVVGIWGLLRLRSGSTAAKGHEDVREPQLWERLDEPDGDES